ncbi:hypothetical protein B7P43_G00854 [Cryptotermes secundus]|uniref:CD80-like immunoglobulin C2-set domain-containing protein n=1 Tax=Cryptotermes secundus TaxID=105785 RepID=A0A2J7PKA4_9NEOP|nr:hypothetical protein B7P43_G00854 [Cryptotermes secundus]
MYWLRSLGNRDRGFESHSGHGCLVCVQVETLRRADHPPKVSYLMCKIEKKSEVKGEVHGALPEEGPRITGGRPRYQIGDTVRVNCTSGRSKPAAQLMWFINGEQADSNFLRGPETVYTGREGLETAILGLEFRVKPKHFRRGDMKLKCLATIATVYWRSNEESVEGDKPQKAPVLESRETVPPSKSRADRVQATGSCAPLLPCAPLLAVCGIIALVTTHLSLVNASPSSRCSVRHTIMMQAMAFSSHFIPKTSFITIIITTCFTN